MNYLYSYRMTNDSGFAPNPFHGIMTLANCKPKIRKNKRLAEAINEGVFIAGFTSNELYNRIGKSFGKPRMVFIMKVAEILSYEKYWNDKRFCCKKPPELLNILDSDLIKNQTPPLWIVGKEQDAISYSGDNIYEPLENGDHSYFIHHDNINHPCHYRQNDLIIQLGNCKWQPCHHQNFEIIDINFLFDNYNKYRKHTDEDRTIRFVDLFKQNRSINDETIPQKDLKGLNVLISDEFFYFGSKPINVVDKFKINIPDGQSALGQITNNINPLWQFLENTYEKKKVLNAPHNWPANALF